MRCFLFALVAFAAMTSSSFGQVSLGYIQNADPAVGFKSYTVQATGTCINLLGKFTITGDVNQVWTAPDTQSEWINNPNGHTPGDLEDSYVIFGTARMPDVPPTFSIESLLASAPMSVTMETIHEGGTEGLGTLNNVNSGTGIADAYMVMGTPSQTEETHDLFHLVVPEDEDVVVGVEILTTEYDPETGYYTIVTTYEFFGDDALYIPVPEPATMFLLTIGTACLFLSRRCGRKILVQSRG